MDSTYIDIFLYTVIGLFSLKGLNGGFVSESKGIIALIVAFLTSHTYAPITKEYLNEYMKISPSAIDGVSIFITFILIVIAVYVIAFFIYIFILRNGALGFYDKILGMLFSLAQIIIILSIITYSIEVFVKIDKDKQVWLDDSISYQYLKEIGFKLLGKHINKDTNIIDSLINNIFTLDVMKNINTNKMINDEVEEAIENLKDSDTLDELKDTYLK
jgi:membrane protein required for colicin V production